MLEDTEVFEIRDWRKFLLQPDARVILQKDIADAQTIKHTTIINGLKVTDTYHKWQPDFPKGQDIAKITIETFFIKIFINRDRLKQNPEMAKKFKDTLNGWIFHLSEEDYMEVTFVH